MSSIEHLKKNLSEAANSYLRRSAMMDPLHGVGSLYSLNPENRVQGPPLPSSYLQPHVVNYETGSNPPPLPRREYNMNRPGYSGYNSYSGYGVGGYSGMPGLYSPYGARRYNSMYSSNYYSPYSNYRSPYGSYGAPNDAYNSFLQMAEESTRPAFESIESVVNVVNSISMMLESTFHAVHSSYSAILGVVGQFSNLKSHLAEVFSILTMLKGLQWLCLKVLYLLGLRKTNPSIEAAWKTASKAVASGTYPSETQRSAWPFFMFLSLVIGAPWLMFKLLSKSVAKKPFDPNTWINPDGRRFIGYAAYDFNGTQPGELSFSSGDKLILHPKDANSGKGWILACNEQNESGLIPKNYLRVPNSNNAGSAANQNRLSLINAAADRYNRNSSAPRVQAKQQPYVSVPTSVETAYLTESPEAVTEPSGAFSAPSAVVKQLPSEPFPSAESAFSQESPESMADPSGASSADEIHPKVHGGASSSLISSNSDEDSGIALKPSPIKTSPVLENLNLTPEISKDNDEGK